MHWLPSFVGLFVLGTAISTATANSTKGPLNARQTDSGLAFKILQVPDLHFTANASYPCNGGVANLTKCTEAYMEFHLRRMLDDIEPDLVVFSGDQIEALMLGTSFNAEEQIRAYSKCVIARQLPWAIVFGNHDEHPTRVRDFTVLWSDS
ncbi:hypothetical protein AeMF1_014244 [Aphanomyces euteiches]|nr:hypothetical protein AeMF1_014244 [Aphanomyces euteiches]KAH9166045.1 hypothetical protein AeNC1_018405 [Aphanomyces euteiches]